MEDNFFEFRSWTSDALEARRNRHAALDAALAQESAAGLAAFEALFDDIGGASDDEDDDRN